MTYSVIDHHVYGKVLGTNGKMVVVEGKDHHAAEVLAEKYGGSTVQSMAKNWIIKIEEEHKPVTLIKKNKYKRDGPSVKSIQEWVNKPETKALYLEKYGSEKEAEQKLQETFRKLEEAFSHNEIIHNKKTISQIRRG